MATFDKLFLLFLLLGVSQCRDPVNGLKYEAPDDCQWTVRQVNGMDEVALSCRLRTINSEIDSTNFSLIPAEHTTSLTVECNPALTSRSSLPERSFAHLSRLREFSLLFCKLSKLPAGVLYGLPDLRNLTIQTYNEEWSLELASNIFSPVRQLERLDFSFNNLWTVPEGIFCPLNNLFALNVSHNKLQDIDDFGFRSAKPSEDDFLDSSMLGLATTEPNNKAACSLDLQVLDASHNSFGHIPARTLSSLRRLRELRINNNDLTSVSDRSLNGLKTLRILDISNNKLVALPHALFKDCGDIQELYLQNNSLGALAPELLSGLVHLQSLDLSRNRLDSTSLDSNTFAGLIRLVLLDLSHNRITTLNPMFFKDLYTLQILNLEHNLLESLPADSFSPMNNLHTLVLSYNRLATLEPFSFSGLFALALLSLDNNVLRSLHEDSLRNCTALQDLNLNGNSLTSVPAALQDMRLLRTVDLGENSIEQLDEPGFRGMNNLYGLRLIGNQITNLSRNVFSELPALQILNLARNKIKKIELGAFSSNFNLQAIRLDANSISDISGIFSKLPNLLWLNVSDNQLTWFDYDLIPTGLQWLDLHKNKIKEIGDSKRRSANSELKLQTLDVSYNLLSKVNPSHVPSSIELIFLNDNQISSVEAHTFVGKPNLTRVDLYANQIVGMDLNAMRLTPVSDDKPLPEFYIGGNPFTCDCTMEWLQRINTLDHLRQHPKVMDLESVYCRLPYSRDRTFIPLVEAESSHFVCAYTSHCFAICHCCDFDACDCKMTCPANCTCYHDQSWSAANIVDCSSANQVRLPGRIPMDATEVYLDGNMYGELPSHQFIGRKNLRVLYVNGSKVESISNNTFSGLKRLQILHLEDNNLRELHGFEFQCLEEIRELYLQNNKIYFIDNRTFADLRQMEVLRLDGNRLHNFPVWQFTLNPYLARVTLGDNNWSCHCQYMRDFRVWLRTNIAKVSDSTRISCVLRIQPTPDGSISKQLGPSMADFNSTACSSFLTGGGYLDSEYDEKSVTVKAIKYYLPLILAIIAAFALASCLIFAAAYHRKTLRLWMYSRCGVKICYFSSSNNHSSATTLDDIDIDDRARLFDAYISYSMKDEGFVNQVLAAGLEPQYRLCLHYRDCSASSYIADAILDAVESSRRSVIVLSHNFLTSEWCRFEFKSALREALQRDLRRVKRKNLKRLIIILLGDLPPRDLDPDLRVYINKTAVCVKWGEKRFWEKLRSAMPESRSKHLGPCGGLNDPSCRDGGGSSSSVLCCCSKGSGSSGVSSGSRNLDSGHVVYEYSSIVGPPPPAPPSDCYETVGRGRNNGASDLHHHDNFLPQRGGSTPMANVGIKYGTSSLRRHQEQSLWA